MRAKSSKLRCPAMCILWLELYLCIKFRGNRSRGFGFRTWNPPRKFGVKSGLSQKLLKYGKKYFIWLYVLRHPFIPTNSLLAAMRFFLFFPFISSLFLYALLLLNHKTPKFNCCVKLLGCKRNFFSRNFWATPPETLQNGAPKINFSNSSS